MDKSSSSSLITSYSNAIYTKTQQGSDELIEIKDKNEQKEFLKSMDVPEKVRETLIKEDVIYAVLTQEVPLLNIKFGIQAVRSLTNFRRVILALTSRGIHIFEGQGPFSYGALGIIQFKIALTDTVIPWMMFSSASGFTDQLLPMKKSDIFYVYLLDIAKPGELKDYKADEELLKKLESGVHVESNSLLTYEVAISYVKKDEIDQFNRIRDKILIAKGIPSNKK